MAGLNSRLNEEEERISEMKKKIMETTKSKQFREKLLGKKVNRASKTCETITKYLTQCHEVLKEEDKG